MISGALLSCRQYRAKNGTPGIHGLQGEDLRLLRVRREHPHADFVFLSELKAPLSVGGAQKLIERHGVAANAHMLRHAASYALAAGQGRCDLYRPSFDRGG